MRAQLDLIRIVEIDTPEGKIVQRTDITPGRKRIFSRLGVAQPKKIHEISFKNRDRA